MDFDLVEQLKVSLFENSIDVAIDFAEIGLDNLLSDITDSEILQEIPIIKTIYSVCNTLYESVKCWKFPKPIPVNMWS